MLILINYFTDEEIKIHENFLKISKYDKYKSFYSKYESSINRISDNDFRKYFCIFKIKNVNKTDEYLLLKSNINEIII